MQIHTLKPGTGSKGKKKIVGRGNGSGHGTYSCRGCKGQGQHAGSMPPIGHEGGQSGIGLRMPKVRGKSRNRNVNRVEYQPVNLASLNQFDEGSKISAAELYSAGLIPHKSRPVKVLGDGKIEKNLVLNVNKISASAMEAVKKAGGDVNLIVKKVSEHTLMQIAKTAAKKKAKAK